MLVFFIGCSGKKAQSSKSNISKKTESPQVEPSIANDKEHFSACHFSKQIKSIN